MTRSGHRAIQPLHYQLALVPQYRRKTDKLKCGWENKVRSNFLNRELAATIAGVLTFLAVGFGFLWASRELSITTYIDYGETRLVRRGDIEYEVSGYSSPLGLAGGLIAMFGGFLVWQLICRGPLAVKDRLNFQSIFAGLLFYGVIGQIWFEIFYGNKWGNFFVYVLEIATAAFAYYLFKHWRNKRLNPNVQIDIADILTTWTLVALFIAALVVYGWSFLTLFDILESLLQDTILENFTFIIQISILFAFLIGIILIPVTVKNWWTRKKKAATKIVNGD